MLAVGWLASAVAGESDDGKVANKTPITMEEMVVTGTKVETPAWEATVPTQVVPREVVEETATINAESVLDDIPGVYVRRNELFGLGASTIRMQGADPNKVAILLDGRRFRGGIDGVVDLRDIPANNVERIEVIRGPASSLYGSDAMAGVVNIITRSGTPDLEAEGAAATGSFGRRFYAGSHGWQRGPVRWFLSGLHDEFRLFEQFGEISEQFAGANRREKQVRDQGNVRLDFDLGEHHGITLAPSYQQVVNPDSTSKNLTASGEWRWQTGPGSQLTTWANRYGFDRKNDLPGFEEDVDFVDYEAESRWATELGPRLVWDSNVLTSGLRGRTQSLDTAGRRLGTVDVPAREASVWQLSPFLQSDVLFGERWSLLVGSSFDVHERYGLDVNPRATLTYRPTHALRLSATVGRGFRAPDLTQLFTVDVNAGGAYALLGNPDLRPETDLAFNLEAAFRIRGVDGFATLFRHQFKDLIVFTQVPVCVGGGPPGCIVDPLPGLPSSLRFQTRNFAEAITQGVEVGVDVSILEVLDIASPHRPSLGLGYGFVDSENKNGIPGEDGNDLPFRPRHRVLPSFGYRYEPWKFSLRIWGEYETDTFTDAANSPDFVASEHWLWSFKATIYPLRALPDGGPRALARAIGIGEHVGFFAQGENVFDEEFGPVTPTGRLAGPAAFLFGITARF